MKIINRKLFFITILLLLMGCNEIRKAPSSKEKTTTSETERANNLVLFFDGFFDFDGIISLFYEHEAKDSLFFTAKKMPNNWQRTQFVFPNKSIPQKIKIKIPKNKKIEIKFDKIVLRRQESKIIIKDSTLLVYFLLQNLEHSFNGDKVTLQKKDTLKESYLISKQNLNNRIFNRYK